MNLKEFNNCALSEKADESKKKKIILSYDMMIRLIFNSIQTSHEKIKRDGRTKNEAKDKER